MATSNPFDLLGDDDNDDPSQLIAAVQQQKVAAKKTAAPAAAAAATPAAAKLPSKPLPPTQAVREARSNPSAPARGAAGRGGLGRGGRGGRGGEPRPYRDFGKENVKANGYSGGHGAFGGGAGVEDGDGGKPADRERVPYSGPRQSFRGGRRGGYSGGEGGEDSERPPRRVYERKSGTGRGYEMKREGAGRGNWGSSTDESLTQEIQEKLNVDDKVVSSEKKADQDDVPLSDVNKDGKEAASNEAEQKQEEEKEMTLEEYEKIREEKRKALLAMKTEERKVDIDKELQSMQQLSMKKGNGDFFIKLGSDKDSKKKENADRDERAKKSMSINEFLKPVEGERYYNPGGRGRGRGRGGDRGPNRGGYGYGGAYAAAAAAAAPSIEDPGQFPTLGGK